MSGGIDSSMAAWALQRDAHEVVGVTLRFHESRQRASALERAQATALSLGIEHHVVDLREKFAQLVKKPTAQGFAEGLFCNPCVACTSDLKIPALFEQAEMLGCDYVATGHYARITQDEAGFRLLKYQLRVPLDKFKEQTFLLYKLTQEQMSHMLFPLEDMHKGEVRRDVMRYGLMRLAPVDDGQGEPCFYDGKGYLQWLEGEGGLKPDSGEISYIGDGSVVGRYEGQYRFAPDASLGSFSIKAVQQLHCDNSDESPLAVEHEEELFAVMKDVGEKRIIGAPRALAGSEMTMVRDVHWTSVEPPDEKRSCKVRLAYGRKPLPAQILIRDGRVIVAFNERVMGVRAGQPLVFYSDDIVLGGGIAVG